MQYSKLLFALPVASAAVIARNPQPESANYAYTTVVQTVVVTQGAAAPTSAATQAAASHASGHGHGQFHSSAAAATASAAPASTTAAASPPSSASASSAAAPSASSGSTAAGSSSSGGCPADTSGQHTSPGVNGKPAKSMLDSINYIRRLYNANANCLSWSESLASASQTCANDSSESHLRVNSDIVSAPGYEKGEYYTGNLASSEYERSMIWMLCQSPSDPELKGTCSGKTAEAGCSSGACTGHHDAIVDKSNENKFMGCGSSTSTSWLSCSFSATDSGTY